MGVEGVEGAGTTGETGVGEDEIGAVVIGAVVVPTVGVVLLVMVSTQETACGLPISAGIMWLVVLFSGIVVSVMFAEVVVSVGSAVARVGAEAAGTVGSWGAERLITVITATVATAIVTLEITATLAT